MTHQNRDLHNCLIKCNENETFQLQLYRTLARQIHADRIVCVAQMVLWHTVRVDHQ